MKGSLAWDGILERFGFEPSFLPDYKGLRGDPSDNIIGIEGIGEKSAAYRRKSFFSKFRVAFENNQSRDFTSTCS